MITLSISRTNLTVPDVPLTINDSGAGTYVLVALQPGAKARDNAIASSRWIDGGALVSTKVDLLSLDLVVRINAATVPLLLAAADTLDTALAQRSYTITQQVSGAVTATTYTCLPASTNFPYDPVQFRAGTGVFTATILRQP